MKSNVLFLIVATCYLLSCSTSKESDLSSIHDEKMKERKVYGITIRPNGDTIVHSALSVKVHFFERLDGTFKAFNNNKLIKEFIVVNGQRNGESKTYYSGGQLMKLVTWLKGKIHGRYVEFHENGTKKKEGFWYETKKIGIWKYWDENGNLIESIDYGSPPVSDSQ
ncbi:toxin-antitoxin system YwqK family antitoxin [Marinifilum caeruleilacunae]|nr:hypothetical protein [Marinifilum caeruleilacunae]